MFWLFKEELLLPVKNFFIANVYAPCDLTTKLDLWNRLTHFISNVGDSNLCICGDFNSVRSEAEMKGRNAVSRQLDSDNFNNFIDGGSLIDLLLCGKLFT